MTMINLGNLSADDLLLINACADPTVFIRSYCHLYDNETERWIPFALWPAQAEAIRAMQAHRRLIILKPRQIGLTWCAASFVLWNAIFKPGSSTLITSIGDREAKKFLARIMGMIARLPGPVQVALACPTNEHEITLANGSTIESLPPGAGHSFAVGTVVIDEAAKMQTDKALERVLESVQPIVDKGGRLVMLSTPEKSRPNSMFNRTFEGAVAGKNNWTPLFLPWQCRPGRTQPWYDQELASQTYNRGSREAALDYMHQEYPATAAEALAARTTDKRIPASWLCQCYQPLSSMPVPRDAQAIPGLVVYRVPDTNPSRPKVRYVVAGDPAEGNPNSDDSACHVLRVDNGEEVASFAGKHEPALFAGYVDRLAAWYNQASIMIERNNHGHAVLLWLKEHSRQQVMAGHDDKPGWLSSEKGKSLLYATACDLFKNRETILHSLATHTQLTSIEGATQRAPQGQHDDRAMSFVMGLQAVMMLSKHGSSYVSRMRPQDNPFHPSKVPPGVFMTDRDRMDGETYLERVRRLRL